MARQSKYSEEIVEKLTYALGLGAPILHACNYAGISDDTFARWRKSNADFADKIKRAEGEAVATWLGKIEDAARDGNWQAAAWKLERRYPQDFGRRDRITVDVNKLDSDIDRELAILTARSQGNSASETESEESVH